MKRGRKAFLLAVMTCGCLLVGCDRMDTTGLIGEIRTNDIKEEIMSGLKNIGEADVDKLYKKLEDVIGSKISDVEITQKNEVFGITVWTKENKYYAEVSMPSFKIEKVRQGGKEGTIIYSN